MLKVWRIIPSNNLAHWFAEDEDFNQFACFLCDNDGPYARLGPAFLNGIEVGHSMLIHFLDWSWREEGV